jgi:uncharacterized protein YbcC (UPF0753/DUF2309 family)
MTTTTTAHLSSPRTAPRSLEPALAACRRIPPLWPLRNFVAVNPFLGLTDRPFLAAAGLLDRVGDAPALMDAAHYEAKYRAGAIRDEDLEQALRLAGAASPDLTVTHLKLWLHGPGRHPERSARWLTVAETADRLLPSGWSRAVTEEISKHGAAFYDEGQGPWRMPWKTLGLYAAWRETARIDATLPLLGWHGFREFVAALPADPRDALARLLGMLDLDPLPETDYLHRLLLSVFGWSAHVQFRVRENTLQGIPDDSLLQLLVIRLAHDAALLARPPHPDLAATWQAACRAAAQAAAAPAPDLVHAHLWQLASEIALQRGLVRGLASPGHASPGTRKTAQAVFCIDVRSEIFRRSLEAASPDVETFGFAGFFGMPVEVVPFSKQQGDARCPVLLVPRHRVRERPCGCPDHHEPEVLAAHLSGRRLRHAWNAFQTSAVSCFSFVETAGWSYAWNLFKQTFLTHLRAEETPEEPAFRPEVHRTAAPDVADWEDDTGIAAEDQVALAWGALRHLGLTRDFARLVLFCGHGGESANNAFASSLDCGACGGHAGDANARIAATLLNLPRVRQALSARGVEIPHDTVFLAGLHNTTTDEVTLFDTESVPESHAADLAGLRSWLDAAGQETRRLRAPRLGLGTPSALAPFLDAALLSRAEDWSQVRPEWGLAGNAAFIAAPRERTRHLDLQGRVFLHDYRAERDEDGSTLELILTAPVIVASWINLQYYASTVNHDLFGAGNKVLHNVVGTLGVCLGNGGDLRTGLPLQSLHDGQRWVHDPLRLSVFVETTRERISLVVSQHEDLRRLVDHEWIHLFAIEDEGRSIHRYRPGHAWLPA